MARTLRVLRPLVAIQRLKQLSLLANSLVLSLPKLMNVFFFMFVFTAIMAIVGLELFMVCALPGTPLRELYRKNASSADTECLLVGMYLRC